MKLALILNGSNVKMNNPEMAVIEKYSNIKVHYIARKPAKYNKYKR